MRQKRSRGLKGITGLFKELSYRKERCELERKWDVCSPMQEYFRDNPGAAKEHHRLHERAVTKLNKKYGKH